MKKVKIVSLLVLFFLSGAFIVTFSACATLSKDPAHVPSTVSKGTLPGGGLSAATPTVVATPLLISLTPKAAPTNQIATPGVTATGQPVGPTPTTPSVTAAPSISAPDRYFSANMSASAMQSASKSITKQQVKILIEGQVDKNWSVIQSKLGFTTIQKAYAFFLGFASRESTLQVALETGSGPSHAYGPLQAAEPAYINSKGYTPENDVTQMVQYNLTPQNFYDPSISIHSGIRHFLHFVDQAQAAGYTGVELLRHALIGYNTGAINGASASWMQQYSDEIGAMAGWYLSTGHLTDAAYTWTNSPDVNRSNPWDWY